MNTNVSDGSLQVPRHPVAIGGIGGSGTRLVAGLLAHAGFYLGSDLNDALDNLWFTLLFKRPDVVSASDRDFRLLTSLFTSAMNRETPVEDGVLGVADDLATRRRAGHSREWLAARAQSLRQACRQPARCGLWGWKEPNTHIVIDRLLDDIPSLTYVHVLRNGLDMAFRSNQQQLAIWGRLFMGASCRISPYYALQYWRLTTQRILSIASARPGRVLVLSFDEMCARPECVIGSLLAFLGLSVSDASVAAFSRLIVPPRTIGGFRRYGLRDFDPADVEFVRELGFDTRIT